MGAATRNLRRLLRGSKPSLSAPLLRSRDAIQNRGDTRFVLAFVRRRRTNAKTNRVSPRFCIASRERRSGAERLGFDPRSKRRRFLVAAPIYKRTAASERVLES